MPSIGPVTLPGANARVFVSIHGDLDGVPGRACPFRELPGEKIGVPQVTADLGKYLADLLGRQGGCGKQQRGPLQDLVAKQQCVPARDDLRQELTRPLAGAFFLSFSSVA